MAFIFFFVGFSSSLSLGAGNVEESEMVNFPKEVMGFFGVFSVRAFYLNAHRQLIFHYIIIIILLIGGYISFLLCVLNAAVHPPRTLSYNILL